jgi:hypothetical protein
MCQMKIQGFEDVEATVEYLKMFDDLYDITV